MAKMFMSRQQFDKWVADMYSSYDNRGYEFNNVRLLCIEPSEAKGRTFIMNLKTGRTVVAKKHKDDKFSHTVGVAVAWAKYINKPIPTIADYTDYRQLRFLDKFYTCKSDNATLYEFIGLRQSDNIRKNVGHNIDESHIECMIIYRNPKTGEIFENTETFFAHNVAYDSHVWRVEK